MQYLEVKLVWIFMQFHGCVLVCNAVLITRAHWCLSLLPLYTKSNFHKLDVHNSVQCCDFFSQLAPTHSHSASKGSVFYEDYVEYGNAWYWNNLSVYRFFPDSFQAIFWIMRYFFNLASIRYMLIRYLLYRLNIKNKE